MQPLTFSAARSSRDETRSGSRSLVAASVFSLSSCRLHGGRGLAGLRRCARARAEASPATPGRLQRHNRGTHHPAQHDDQNEATDVHPNPRTCGSNRGPYYPPIPDPPDRHSHIEDPEFTFMSNGHRRPQSTDATAFDARTDALFAQLRAGGLWKHLRMLEGPMDAIRRDRGLRRVPLLLLQQLHLGLANHPEVVEADIKALRSYGAEQPASASSAARSAEELEARIARYMGTESSLFVSCWNANEAVFNDPIYGGCIFINAAAEFPDPRDPVHQIAAEHKRKTRDGFELLARQASLKDPGSFADLYTTIFEGTLILRHVHGRNDAAKQAKGFIEQLINGRLPSA